MADPADDLGIDLETDSGVVVEIAPKSRLDGKGYEWTYRFRREYDFQGSTKVAFFFRHGEHDLDISRALVQAIDWMNGNDPNAWVSENAA